MSMTESLLLKALIIFEFKFLKYKENARSFRSRVMHINQSIIQCLF